jgi:hypothetical protein
MASNSLGADQLPLMPPGTQSNAVVTMPNPRPRHEVYDTQPQGTNALRLAELTKPFHQKLIEEAKNSLKSSLFEMAVVLSQAASEMCTEWAITALFALRDDKDLAEPILGLFVVKDICSERVQRVYSALSGDSPNQQPFWARLKSHRDRRNAVVHRGEKASPNEAAESVAVVNEYLLHVEAVLAGLQAKQSPKP